MSFWDSFSDNTEPALDKLLKGSPGPEALAEVVADDTFLAECKSRHKLLIDYLTQDAVLNDFLDLIATEPPADANDLRRYKLPAMSCEGICSGAEALLEACTTERALGRLLGFLERPAPFAHPPTSTTSCKAVGYLASVRPNEVHAYLRAGGAGLVAKLAAHAASAGVENLLVRLCADEELSVWVAESGVVEAVARAFAAPEASEATQEACSQLLCALCEASASVRARAVGAAASAPVVQAVFEQGECTPALLHGLHLAAELLLYAPQSSFDAQLGTLCPVTQLASSPLAMLQIRDILTREPCEPMSMTFGALAPPLGLHRLEAVRVLSGVVRTGHSQTLDAVLVSGVLAPMVDLFFKFYWNTFLHQAAYEVFRVVLESPHAQLKQQMLSECRLVDRILEADQLCSNIENKFGSAGFMGHITKISKQMADSTDPAIRAAIDGRADWKAYVAVN
eukprot:m51a1_g4958 hypothetical protein (453) ;mRNA; f:353665-355507